MADATSTVSAIHDTFIQGMLLLFSFTEQMRQTVSLLRLNVFFNFNLPLFNKCLINREGQNMINLNLDLRLVLQEVFSEPKEMSFQTESVGLVNPKIDICFQSMTFSSMQSTGMNIQLAILNDAQ